MILPLLATNPIHRHEIRSLPDHNEKTIVYFGERKDHVRLTPDGKDLPIYEDPDSTYLWVDDNRIAKVLVWS